MVSVPSLSMKEFTSSTIPLSSRTFWDDGNILFLCGSILSIETWNAATATTELTFLFYLILINFKSPVWLVAKKAPIPTSIKITFNLSLLSDKVSKHKAETMEEGRTCIIQKWANLSKKKNWTAHLKIRN